MKTMYFLVCVLMSVAFATVNASAHGGGCRKDSPRGQCCHAGSQPYHCH